MCIRDRPYTIAPIRPLPIGRASSHTVAGALFTTGETSSISERPQEENYSAPAGAAAEKVVQHIGAEVERHAAKGAEKKAIDAAQPKTHSSRLQFSEAEMCIRDRNTTKIRNIKQYLKAVLFNAPSTIDSYYTALVNHDFYGSK